MKVGFEGDIMPEIKYKFQIGDHVKSCGKFAYKHFDGIIKMYSANYNGEPCYLIQPTNNYRVDEDQDMVLKKGLPSWYEGFLELVEPTIPISTCLDCGDIL